MKVGICFSGQGAQSPGMFKKLYDEDGDVKELFHSVGRILNRDIAGLCFEGTKEDLKITINTQPCVLVCDIAAWLCLKKKKLEPNFFAGFSVGEYAALYAAGCLSLKDTFDIIKVRSEAMQEAVPYGIGAMAALSIDDLDTLHKIFIEANACNIWVSNINTKGQVVVSGYVDDVDKVCKHLDGIATVNKLPVSAPFHCELMEPAVKELEKLFLSIDFNDVKIPIICNYDAIPTVDGSELKRKVLLQTKSPVLWKNTMEVMHKNGVDTFVECGPGRTLTGFVRKMMYDITSVNVNDTKSLENSLKVLLG
ncbi:MAG: ACP S-malonyltransferase [Lutisporaceae bacterium]